MSIEVVPCIRPGSVDLRSSNHSPGDEVLHFSASEWAEFVTAVKTGEYDHLSVSGSGEDERNPAR